VPFPPLPSFPVESLPSSGHWFLASGIQEPSGGVARYFRTDLGRNAPISTEITGYALSTLLFLQERTGETGYSEAARAAARFLTGCAWNSGASHFPFEIPGPEGGGRAYFFDSGIVIRGLLAMFRAKGDRGLLDVAVRCGRSMAADFASPDGFHPILELPSKMPAARDARWSRGPGCYQLKAALAWVELAEAAGQPEFETPYEQVLEYSLRGHAAFPEGEPGLDRVMDRLHAYCYFLEGLLPSAGRPECAAALAAGIGRAEELLNRAAPVFERSDVYAQLLRARLFAAALGVNPLDERAAGREAGRLIEFRCNEPGRAVQGGFWFGRKGGNLLPYVNPVSTAFSLQALEMLRQYKAGTFQPDWRALI
jgi:hypothetical protein